MMQVERHFHRGNDTIVALCRASKELYNACNFVMRQAWFGGRPIPNISDLWRVFKGESCLRRIGNAQTATQTLRMVLADWRVFFGTLRAWKANPTFGKPKPPGYKKHLAKVIFYSPTIKGGQSGKVLTRIVPTNKCFDIPSTRKFKQVVITPKSFGFVIDVQYEVTTPAKSTKPGVCGIDLGLNTLAAITSDQHPPILVNGRIVKSINQWYNKRPSKQRCRKRYWRLENYFHHVSRMIISNCLKHGIGTIIIGKNDGWKARTNLGRKTNQQFHYIPFCKLIQKISYKAELAGLNVMLTEEAYTSKASYLDRDPLPAYQKNASLCFSGKRVSRGRYLTKSGRIINADVNGSANICRKIIKNEETLLRLDRSVAATPVRVNPLKFFCV